MEPLVNEARDQHLKVKICVSGTADTSSFNENILEIGKEVGAEIARQGAVIVTGATTGFPLWAAKGAKEAGGFSIGLSPAETEEKHVKDWELPIEYMDVIIYTGQGYPGRDILLTRTSDAIVIGPGRIGTFHEFTVAFEDHKPLGVLEGDWLTDDIIKEILENAHRPNEMVVFDSDPKKLVAKLIEMVKARKVR
ncbi:MAG: hypothetical protein AAB900_00635 [Patescibacteria group bacterium]